MKRGIYILIAAVLAGAAGFVITRHQCDCTMPVEVRMHDGSSQLPELAWLQHEFQLADDQFAQVAALHLAYRPTCEMLCAKVVTSQAKVKQLAGAGTEVTPELKAALQDLGTLHGECQTAMLAHLYQTAACMSPTQAKRYLDAMLPQVIEMTMAPDAKSGGR